MKIIKINSSTSTNTRTIHGVNVPSSFSSESERSQLLDSLFDLDLNKAQVTEVRTAIKAVPIATNNASDTIKREYAINSEMLFGTFVDGIGNATKGTGTKDLPKEWNKAGSYDKVGNGAFQVSTGIQCMVFYEGKDIDTTIFNGTNKRAGNNIKSDICTFADNQNNPSPKVFGEKATMEEANEARSMYIEGMSKLLPELKKFYEAVAALNIEPITLENVRKRIAKKHNSETESGKAKAMKVIETEAQEQGLTTEDYILVQVSQNGFDSPEAYISSRIAA